MCGNSFLENRLNGTQWKPAHEAQGPSLERDERRYLIGEFLGSVKDSAISSDRNDVIDDLLMQGYLELVRDILRMPGGHLLKGLRVIEVEVGASVLGQCLCCDFDQPKHLLLLVDAADHQHCNCIIALHPKLKVTNVIILNY